MEARRRIAADPFKRRLLESSRAEHREDEHLSAPPTHDELAAGEVGLPALE
jgi:hypothetical protein